MSTNTQVFSQIVASQLLALNLKYTNLRHIKTDWSMMSGLDHLICPERLKPVQDSKRLIFYNLQAFPRAAPKNSSPRSFVWYHSKRTQVNRTEVSRILNDFRFDVFCGNIFTNILEDETLWPTLSALL